MDNSCLFCKIIAGEVPSTKVYEDENVFAFEDINPSAQTHVLFIHKKHSKNLTEMMSEDPTQMSDVFTAIAKWTKEQGLDEKGYRLVNNCGESAGQTVFHTHFHILSDVRLGGFGK